MSIVLLPPQEDQCPDLKFTAGRERNGHGGVMCATRFRQTSGAESRVGVMGKMIDRLEASTALNLARKAGDDLGIRFVANHGHVALYEDRVITPSGTFPLGPDVSAAVDTAGEIDRRVTATRLVLTGPFALALKKKKDRRELFLYIDAAGGQHVEPCNPKEQAKVRAFAAKVTSAARASVC